jgi:hypothetical protein
MATLNTHIHDPARAFKYRFDTSHIEVCGKRSYT